MIALNLSAITFQSNDPARLAEFYREKIGLPLQLDQHGSTRPHHEGDLNEIHLAVFRAGPQMGGPIVPVFRVRDVRSSTTQLRSQGVELVHDPMDLGEGMTVAGFKDPDGNVFRLIEIDAKFR